MRIAVASHYFAPEIGAPSARIRDLAVEWIRAGHEVDVITCFPNHPAGVLHPGYRSRRYQLDILDGIRVHRCWTYITPNRGFLKKSLGHLTFWPSAALSAISRLPAPDITIGTSPTFFAAMVARAAARRHRVPFVMEVRDLWPAALVELNVLRIPWAIRLLERWEMSLYRSAAKVVLVTRAFRDNLAQRGLPPGRLGVIPNGADVDYWRFTRKPTALAQRLGLEGRFVVLYIGAHGISQALAAILEAAAQCAEDPDIQFVFVGDGAEKPRLEERARQLGLRHIRFLPAVGKEEVRDYYALADVCLVPLRHIELFKTFIPSKMFEMLAMERPIVASLEGEAADILRASGGAVVVPPEDSRAIAAALKSLKPDVAGRARLGQSGRAFVEERFSRRALARDYLDLLATTVGTANPSA